MKLGNRVTDIEQILSEQCSGIAFQLFHLSFSNTSSHFFRTNPSPQSRKSQELLGSGPAISRKDFRDGASARRCRVTPPPLASK